MIKHGDFHRVYPPQVLTAVRYTWQAARYALGAARKDRNVLLTSGRWPRSRSPKQRRGRQSQNLEVTLEIPRVKSCKVT